MTQAQAGSNKNPVVAAVAPQLRDPAPPFTLLLDLVIRADAQERFEALFTRLVPPSRAEAGYFTYRLDGDLGRPFHYALSEGWRSLDALRTHFDTEHMAGDLTVGQG